MKLVNIHKQALLLLLTTISIQTAEAQIWSLQQCIDNAQQYNKNIQIGRNNNAIGEQKLKEAKANLIPKITANADYKYFNDLPYQLMPLSTFNPAAPEGQFKEAQFGVPHNINANLQVIMPLYNPQLYGAIKGTNIANELTELQYKKTEEQVYLEISNLYYNAQILQYQILFIDSNIINAEILLKNTQLLNKELLVKGTDVSKIKLQVLQLSTQKKNIESKHEQILNALKLAIGIPIQQQLQIEKNIKYHTSNDFSPTTTLDINIINIQKRMLLSEYSTLNKSRYLPSLTLIGMYGRTGFGYDKQPNDFLRFYPIGFTGIQLSYSLFNGTVTQRKINQKRIELKNKDLQYSLVTEQTNMHIENAILQRTMAKRLVEITTEQIEFAKKIYEQTTLQQKQGIANLTEVLLADNALREVQQNYLTAIIDYLKADLELKKLTGNISKTN